MHFQLTIKILSGSCEYLGDISMQNINANHMIIMLRREDFRKQFWIIEVFHPIVYAHYRDSIICCRCRCVCIFIYICMCMCSCKYMWVCSVEYVNVYIYVYVCAQACGFMNVWEHVHIFTCFICDIVSWTIQPLELNWIDLFCDEVMALLTKYPGPLFTYMVQLYVQHGYVIASIIKANVG